MVININEGDRNDFLFGVNYMESLNIWYWYINCWEKWYLDIDLDFLDNLKMTWLTKLKRFKNDGRVAYKVGYEWMIFIKEH